MSTVMVVEDEQVIAQDIADSLATMGYEVAGTAATAEECVEKAAARRPDLVLMDIHLAGELDGVDAAHLLRERFDVPVVFLTAYADDETLGRAKLTAPLGYLIKPFRRTELKSAVEVGLFRDRLERQLRERERWSRTTLRAIGDAVITVDPQGRISFLNAAAEAIMGRTESELRGRLLGDVCRLLNEHTRAPIEDPVRRALALRQVVHLPPNTALDTGDRQLSVEDSVAPIVDDRGYVLGVVLIMREMTERRKEEQQLALADSLSSLGAITASVAHEINNPLMYIMSSAAVARDEVSSIRDLMTPSGVAGGDAPKVEERLSQTSMLLEEVEDGARHIGRIVSDLGQLGRKQPEADRGDVIQALEWALRVSRSTLKHRARVTTRLEPVPLVPGDGVRLRQIFLNLILNAAHAMGDRPFNENELFVSTARGDAGEVLVTVRDTGSGMTPDVLERIFDPFFTTKPADKGTGLGLSVCDRAVRAMGGRIDVQSTPGTGSTFVVRLPAAQTRSGEVRRAVETHARVLVIDDDARVLSALRRMLSSTHEVVVASSGAEALLHIDAGEHFDVVLCDLAMPEMSGAELYDRVCESAPELSNRFLFLTGGSSSGRDVEFLEAHPFLTKPMARDDLLHAIDGLITEARERERPSRRSGGSPSSALSRNMS